MSWIYEGKFIESIDDIPPHSIGFIYIITQISTGKKYIGRKLLTKSSRKIVKGKIKKSRIESNWKDYWSSSPELQKLVKEIGEQDFRREILIFCKSKSELLYAEEFALYFSNALLDDQYFNANIRSKVHRKWFSEVKDFRDRIEILKQKLNN